MDSRNYRAFELTMGDTAEEIAMRGTIILAVIGFLALFCIPALLLASGSFDVATSVIV